MTGFATVPPLQMRVMIQAVKAPALASAANIAAFNLGNALGAWLGGVSITAGLGYIAPTWIGAILTTIALAVAFASGILEKKINYRRAQPAPATLDSAVASARAQHRHSDHC
jgi:DHA1 family inner membrane transport protein